ncbi:MAG: NADH-quinone oxidoreductase subunit L [Candidatus Binatus sp.]|uniref:NADH-quinone oxidoreductase subunit L n=1 Tax=Candidatus Binatus sp. TaxID=2811406 RepID=UPI003C70C5B4
MTVEFPALALILLFPAFGVVFNLFLGPRFGRGAVNVVGPGVMFAAFGVATWAFLTLLAMPPGSALSVHLWGWIEAGRFHSELGLRLDALSGVMVMIVTGVGALIHLYSVGYMAHDEDFARFFTYMNLFAFSMLILILANNLLMMFVGWEGVGLCSYLLIAFWYTNPQYAYNGRKAFVVNRIGDAGFLLGMFTIVATLGAHGVWTLDFVELRNHAALLGGAAATAAGFLLFIGATGKSAQIPLYVWLPDAMVGPTPVSALIHAATMVTAGVYMIARLGFIYTMAPSALDLVATIGAVTAVFAATIAIVQPDIKKVLAYSTISQLGYMFLGVGSGAYASGIFHVMTHAFFKGLLFLCAGSVIHALGGEQDMNKMGGLRRKLPITFWTMFIATLAIAAVPPFSGYFSKDLILEAAYDSGHSWLWFLGVITAGLTSFYMFRLIFMTFFGESRVDSEKQHHLHESPAVMTIPLIVLAILATVGGWVNLPDGLLWGNAFVRFLTPAVGAFKPIVEASPSSLSLVASIASALGIALAYLFYLRLPGIPMLLAWRLQYLYNLLLNKYYIDQLYNLIVTRPLFWVSNNVLNRAIDSFAIDGAADGAGLAVQTSGQIARRAETGNVQNYAFVYLLGALGIVAYYLFLVTH